MVCWIRKPILATGHLFQDGGGVPLELVGGAFVARGRGCAFGARVCVGGGAFVARGGALEFLRALSVSGRVFNLCFGTTYRFWTK